MDFLIDSNIIIYSYYPEYAYLRDIIVDQSSNISEISRLEVLGYHGLKQNEEIYFHDVFNFVTVIFPSQQIFDKAIQIRRQYNLKLGDSLIAATALISDLTIYTRNLNDFERIPDLKSINPIIIKTDQ
jgi:predicted nucleic acid-binding protein